MFQKLMRKQNGNSLIELMIVIAIIGILAAIATLSYSYYLSYSYNKTAEIAARSAYKKAMEFCIMTGACGNVKDVAGLDFKYDSTPEVFLEINSDEERFIFSYHKKGSKKYVVNADGYLKEES